MKVSHLKSGLALAVVGTAAVLMTACGGGQSTAVEEVVQAVPAQDQTPVVFSVASEPEGAVTATGLATTKRGELASYRVADVPSASPAVYMGKALQPTLRTRLNKETQAANVRRGPGLDFEVIGLIDDQRTILVTGRDVNSNWLQIDYQDENGWLAGDLIMYQSLIDRLPLIQTDHLQAEAVEAEAGEVVEAEVEAASEAEEEARLIKQLQAMSCAETPIRGFGQTWQNHPEVRPLLGCPFTNFRRNEHATRAAVQTFERGWMLWLETDTVANVDPIYVFFEDDSSYIRFGDRPLVDAHSYGLTPRGFYKVGDRFAKVYWEELTMQQRGRLGLATNEARDSNGAFQEFEHGRMFWAGESDTIYVIYEGSYDFDGDGQFTWRRGWTSYEDTFEAPVE